MKNLSTLDLLEKAKNAIETDHSKIDWWKRQLQAHGRLYILYLHVFGHSQVLSLATMPTL